MILTCPECATRYQIDPAQFPQEGRKVRCAKCSHVWFQAAPAPEPEAEILREHTEEPAAQTEPEPVAPQRTAYAPAVASHYEETESYAVEYEKPARRRSLRGLGLAFGWIFLALMVLAAGWVAVRFRQDIATLWPQSSSFYAAFGLHVNTRGIEISDKNARFETENGQSVLLISGDLVNITSHELTVPPIRVSLSDDDRHELYHWSFASAVPTLGPGKRVTFQTRLPSPPLAARHIELRFAEPGN